MGPSRRWAIMVILALVLILSWLILEGSGRYNPIRAVFSQVLSPVQFALSRMTRPAFRLVEAVQGISQLEAENEALRRENVELRQQVMTLREAQIENETYRQQLNFKSAVPNYQLLSAEVIGHDPSQLLQYLIIDRGAADGIERGMPVLTAGGLVGRISEVSAASSKVMLITDVSSSVSALIQRSRATGIVQGRLGQGLVMRYIPVSQGTGETVTPGDIVLTAGLGGNFPKRLPIGQVASVSYKDVEMFQEARVIPAVNLYDLEVVMVLLNFTPLDLAQEYEPNGLSGGP